MLQIVLERDPVAVIWERAALAGTAINVGAVGGAIALGAAAVCLIFHFLRMVDDQVGRVLGADRPTLMAHC